MGGHGGEGGTGGGGGGGGGGAGGTVRLVGSVIDATRIRIDVGGGAGGTGGAAGADGNIILETNANLTFEPDGSIRWIDGLVLWKAGANPEVTISRATVHANQHLAGGSRWEETTPHIAGLGGGAAVHGVADLDASQREVIVDALLARFGDSAVAVIARFDTGPAGFDVDYSEYDLIVFVNMSSHISLPNPKIALYLSGTVGEPLALGSIDGTTSIDALGPRQIWATLVPEVDPGMLEVSASLGGDEVIASLSGEALEQDGGIRLDLTAPAFGSQSTLSGFDALVGNTIRDSNGTAIAEVFYALDTAGSALVVINADDLSLRQTHRASDGALSALEGADALVLSSDGQFVIVFRRGGSQLAVFRVEAQTRGLSLARVVDVDGAQTEGGVTAIDDEAKFVGYGSGRLVRFSGALHQAGTPSIASEVSLGTAITDIVASEDGRHLFVTSRDGHWFKVLDASTLAQVTTHHASQMPDAAGLRGASRIAVSSDGRFVYVLAELGNAVSVFERRETGGTVEFLHVQTVRDGKDGVYGMVEPRAMVLYEPDAAADHHHYLYVTGRASDSIAVFVRDANTGTLQQAQQFRHAGVGAMLRPTAVAVSDDGASVHVATRGSGGAPGGVLALEADPAADGVSRIHTQVAFERIAALTLATGGGNDSVSVHNVPKSGSEAPTAVNVSTGAGEDTVRIASSATSTNSNPQHRWTLDVDAGPGLDVLWLLEGASRSSVTLRGGDDADTFRVAGDRLPRQMQSVSIEGDDPGPAPGASVDPDVLIFNPGASAGASFTQVSGQSAIALPGYEVVRYRNVHASILQGPVIERIGNLVIREGDTLPLSVRVTPYGMDNQLSGTVTWSLSPVETAWITLGAGQLVPGGAPGQMIWSADVSWEELRRMGIDDDGEYTIYARAENADGGVTITPFVLTVNDSEPTIEIDAYPWAQLSHPWRVTAFVTDPGDDTVREWRVQWGDGTEDTFSDALLRGRGVTHRYETVGLMTATFTAVHDDGMTSQSFAANVYPPRGAVDVGGPYILAQGEDLIVEGTAAGGPVSHAWLLRAGGTEVMTAQGDVPNATFTWASLVSAGVWEAGGEYTIVHEATYADGITYRSAPETLTIVNVEPVVNITVAPGTTPDEGDLVTLHVTAQYPGSALGLPPQHTAPQLLYSFDVGDDGIFEVTDSRCRRSSTSCPTAGSIRFA